MGTVEQHRCDGHDCKDANATTRFDPIRGRRGMWLCYSCAPKTSYDRVVEHAGAERDSEVGTDAWLTRVEDKLDEGAAYAYEHVNLFAIQRELFTVFFRTHPDVVRARARVSDVDEATFYGVAIEVEHDAKIECERRAKEGAAIILEERRARRPWLKDGE